MSEGLSGSNLLLGVAGVFGLTSEPEDDLFVGVPGALGAGETLGLDLTRLNARVLDSVDMAALNFLWVEARRLGVVERGKRSVDELDNNERGRFGVNGAGRVVLDVDEVAIVVGICEWKPWEYIFTRLVP
jgi:hypothetical protein